jgi:Fe-S cluster assembly ATP-binding protein
VPGVAVDRFLEVVLGRPADTLAEEAVRVGLGTALLDRALNVGLSGGEKKRLEAVQLAVMRPKIAVLDELDSGLDIDALREVTRRVEDLTHDGEHPLGVLVITHYSRLFAELRPDRIHVFIAGRIVESGGPELADELERTGYAAYGVVDEQTESKPLVQDPFADPLA